jgi:hypothetical protein
MTPLEAFQAWFDSLPTEQQQEIASAVLLAAPDVNVQELLGDSFDSICAFRDWVSRRGPLPVKRAGKALVLRAIGQSFVMRHKESSQESKLKGWVQGAREEGYPQLADAFQQAIAQEPFRSRQWRRSLSGWKDLCATALSDDSLDAWAVARRDV